MRTLVLSGATLVLFGCQSTPPVAVEESPVAVAVRDANDSMRFDENGWPVALASPAPAAETSPAPVSGPSIWDPVVGEIVAAMQASYESQRRVICQNIANVDTPGYKRWAVEIAVDSVADPNGTTFQVPRVVGAHRVFSVGCLDRTGRSLDVAIDGDGYFSIILPDGSTAYTRNGSFRVDPDGRFVTSAGHVLIPEITIPSDTLEIRIDPSGLITGRTAGSPDTDTGFGQLAIHRFVNPDGLHFEWGAFRASETSGSPTTDSPGQSGLGLIKQGFVERSNVELEHELLNLQNIEQRHQSIERVMRHLGMIAP